MRWSLALICAAMVGCAVGNKPCPDDLESFEAAVHTPVFAKDCVLCHVEGGAAGSTRMVLAPSDAPDRVERDLATVRALAGEVDPNGLPLLLSKPSGQHPAGHGGGRIVQVQGEQWVALEEFVGWSTGSADDCDLDPDLDAICADGAPGPRVLRRLTRAQYDNSVRDLLGVPSSYGASFAADLRVDGFDNDAAALIVSPLLADQLRVAAESLASDAVDSRLDELLPCEPRDGEATCAADFIETFGRRAFRRPLTGEEVGRYHALWRAVRSQDGRFEDGVEWVISSMLQSPHFLYRSELGARQGEGFVLTDYEIATELSYLLWNTTPSDALLDRAARGELSERDTVEAVIVEMWDDERSLAVLPGFVDQWLHLDQLALVTRDPDVYPELTRALRGQMKGEVDRFVAALAAEGGTLEDLLVDKRSFLTRELADHYGVSWEPGPVDLEGFREIDLTGSPYGGLLTQGALMTTHATPTSSSPIHRGVVVRERLLCDDLPPPPPNLDTSPPPVDPSLSTRERFAQHTELAECADCHDRIDGIGFAFEAFDGIGRYRTMDGQHPVDDMGEIKQSPSSDATFQGVDGLAGALLGGDDLQRCYARLWVRYGFGQDHGALTCAADDVAAGHDQGQLPLAEGPLGLLRTRHFTERTGEPGEASVGWLKPGERFDPGEDPDGGGGGDVELTIEINNDWGGGYCADATVDNRSDGSVTWSILHDVGGNISSIWNAKATAEGSMVRLEGDDWNATLAPNEVASFGFCVDRR